MKYVADTNALIYLLDNRLARPFPSGQYAYSVITEIELLSWPKMQPRTESLCRDLLSVMRRIELDAAIREAAISLRREHRLKLPDALVAASAIHFDAVLLTNDLRLGGISNLHCQPLELKVE